MTAAQLKASILDLAIRGQLVPQNPNDEPAEKLLARIWNERFGHGEHGEIFNAEKQRSRGGAASMKLPRGRGRSPSGPHGRARTLAAPQPIPDEEKPFDLPAGWAWCRLGDLTEIITSGSREWARYYSDSGDVFLRMGNLSRNSFDLRLDTIQHVRPPANSEGARTSLQPLDLLFSITAEIGLLGLIPEGFGKAYINQHTAMIRFVQVLRGKYLPFVLLSSYLRPYYDVGAHGMKSSFRLDTIATFPIPLPPLAEQRRIVAKIEELMPLVKRYEAAEQRRARLDAALPDALKKSILKAAFDGALLEGCAFEEKPLSEACADIFTGNSLSEAEKRTFTRPDGLPFIGTKDVGFDQRVDYENGIRIPQSATYRTAPAGATVLCIEGGSSGRKIGLLDRAVRFGNKLCAFAPGKGLDSRYLFLYLQSPQFLEQFTALQNGPRKGAGISQIKGLSIRVTAPSHQRQLVERIDALLRVMPIKSRLL